MGRKGRLKTPHITILAVSITVFAALSLRLAHHAVSFPPPHILSPHPPLLLSNSNSTSSASLLSVQQFSSSKSSPISTAPILIPDWEILVIASPVTPPAPGRNYSCVFNDNSSSPARLSGELPFGGGTAFKCLFPLSTRRRPPLSQPRLLRTDRIVESFEVRETDVELLRWNFLAYESFKTGDDVVLFVKGVNHRQRINQPPSDLRCVFGDDPFTAVRTAVTSSEQEVFRCVRPSKLPEHSLQKIGVTLEIKSKDVVLLPSVAHYALHQRRTVEFSERKSLLCACTMVYNVGKFLREWVTYHARVGIERFILYDNDSDDGLDWTVRGLNRDGFDVRTVYWPWTKTQEAGFSHCALYAEQICKWVAFVDVDEFILSPTWLDHMKPNTDMVLSSLLPKETNPGQVGQVSIRCVDFGPSNQTKHPVEGVTQGYTCRRRISRRHKSLVLLEAVHPSLLNFVHHFKLKQGFKSIQLGQHRAIVNHYKYQAWPEFRAKFRRRVSAYVVDWRESSNLKSNDRVPGLGLEAIEPPGWPQRFCDRKDERLKILMKRWFAVNSSTMVWQSG